MPASHQMRLQSYFLRLTNSIWPQKSTTCDTLAEDEVIFGEELREETPPPGDYMEEGEEAEEFGFVELEGKNEIDCF